MTKKLVTGILAHVDAGKTTLSEGMLYLSGCIRKMGRVDNRDTFFDTDLRERERGITIFSKQAVFDYNDTTIISTAPKAKCFEENPPLTKVKVKITVDRPVISNNADSINGNTYIWNISKNWMGTLITSNVLCCSIYS